MNGSIWWNGNSIYIVTDRSGYVNDSSVSLTGMILQDAHYRVIRHRDSSILPDRALYVIDRLTKIKRPASAVGRNLRPIRSW